MGFTGLLVLARSAALLTTLGPLVRLNAELVSRRDDGWQLASIDGHLDHAPGCANALVAITAAPTLIAMIRDSTTAVLIGARPNHPAWIAQLNAPQGKPPHLPVTDLQATAAIAEAAVAWAADAGHTADAHTVLEALCPPDHAQRASDADTTTQINRHRMPDIVSYLMRVLAVLGLAMPAPASPEPTRPATHNTGRAR
jgi:hypothetical protein